MSLPAAEPPIQRPRAGGADARTVASPPTYWRVVSRAFYRPPLTRPAVAFAAFLVFIAVFVPFIANHLPYVIRLQGPGGAGRWAFPLFRSLTSADLIILFIAGGAAVLWAVHRRVRGLPTEYAQARRRTAAVWIFGAVVAASVAVGLLHANYLDNTDYPALVTAGRASNALYPPIRWNYTDAEPLEADMIYKPASARHPLGTDGVGADALARLLWACRFVLGIGLIAELISVVIGITYGALMGYFAGIVDILGMRFVEMVESIPTLFLIIIFVAIIGRQIWLITLILGLTGWTGLARFVRAQYLGIRPLDYVSAAVASGAPLRSILFKHIFPNAFSPLLVQISFGVAGAITSESILSFLGLGLEPPTPSFGILLNDAGNPAEVFRPGLALPAGMMIFLTIFACNIIGEALRDAMDPRLNRMQ